MNRGFGILFATRAVAEAHLWDTLILGTLRMRLSPRRVWPVEAQGSDGLEDRRRERRKRDTRSPSTTQRFDHALDLATRAAAAADQPDHPELEAMVLEFRAPS